MPNIISQRVDDNGIYIKTSNGREYSHTPASVLDKLDKATKDDKTGDKEAVKTKVKNTICAEIIAALGADMLTPEDITFLFDEKDGKATEFTVKCKLDEDKTLGS